MNAPSVTVIKFYKKAINLLIVVERYMKYQTASSKNCILQIFFIFLNYSTKVILEFCNVKN